MKFPLGLLLAVVVSGCTLPRLDDVYPLGAVYEDEVPIKDGAVYLPEGEWRVFDNQIFRHDNMDVGTRDEYAGLFLVRTRDDGKLDGITRIIAGSTKRFYSNYHAVSFGLMMCNSSGSESDVFYSSSMIENIEEFYKNTAFNFPERDVDSSVIVKCMTGSIVREGDPMYDWMVDLFSEKYGPLPSELTPITVVIKKGGLYSIAVYMQIEQYASVQDARDAATVWAEANKSKIFKEVGLY